MTGSVTKGHLLSTSPTALVLVTQGVRRDFHASDVRRVQRAERYVGRAALIGLGTGVGIGLIAAAKNGGDSESVGLGLIGGAFWGTVAGLVTGALATTHPTIYVAPTQPSPTP